MSQTPLSKLVTLTSSDKTGFKSYGYIDNEENFIEFSIEYNGSKILTQRSESGIEVTPQAEAIFVTKVIDRLINLGLTKQLELSSKKEE